MKVLLILLSLIGLLAHADIFQWRDDQGQTHFSDKATEKAVRVAIRADPAFYHVSKVFDGDTVLLADGRKVRLLGINTPEVAGRNKSAEPGGETAKIRLTERILNQRIRLVMDAEATDKYGRVLAHVFTEDQRHINAELVAQGLATVVIHPPNLAYADSLLAAEAKAEKARLGIWGMSDYAVKRPEEITRHNYRGWQRIHGRVEAVRWSRKYVYLILSRHMDLRIERKESALFPDFAAYQGKNVEVRGWLNRRKDHFSMLIRHPSGIKMR